MERTDGAQGITASSPAGHVVLCRADDVPRGGMRRVSVPGLPRLTVYNVAGQFYVTDDTCTHADASLSEGELDGDVVVCPVHGGRFHVPTGKPLCFPVVDELVVYEVRIVAGEVRIAVPRTRPPETEAPR